MVLSKEAMKTVLEIREKKFPHPSSQMDKYPDGKDSADYVFDLNQYYWFNDYKEEVLGLLNKGKQKEAEQLLLFDIMFGPGAQSDVEEPKNKAIKLLLEATY